MTYYEIKQMNVSREYSEMNEYSTCLEEVVFFSRKPTEEDIYMLFIKASEKFSKSELIGGSSILVFYAYKKDGCIEFCEKVLDLGVLAEVTEHHLQVEDLIVKYFKYAEKWRHGDDGEVSFIEELPQNTQQ